MAITALNSAAAGLRALSTKIDVIANNLANADTTAFKGSRMNFEDLMYITLKEPGSNNSANEPSPAGTFVGLGVKVSNTQLDLAQGPLENTNRALDVAIEGRGFFRVKIMDAIGDGTGYTRNGSFFRNRDGDLVLGMGDGYKLLPRINIPPDALEISINQEGIIDYIRPHQNTRTIAGQLQISNFINPQGLKLIGGTICVQTEASGQPIPNKPGENGAGTVLQNFLEGSNVDPVKELVALIKTQRAFELNSQSIQTADQALQTIANLRRF